MSRRKRAAEAQADEDARTPWQKQRDAMLDGQSKKYAESSTRVFRLTKAEQLAEVRLERRTRRQALDTMRRKFESLQAEFLRIPATTYEGWLKYGPKAEWEEVLAAVRDDAVWDRLVDRGVVPE